MLVAKRRPLGAEGTCSNGGHTEINGAHSWQRGGQSNSSLRFVPGTGSGLKCSPGDQSTLLLCTMLSSTGWMSPLLPPGMIKVSISLKVTFSASLQECGILGLFFFP